MTQYDILINFREIIRQRPLSILRFWEMPAGSKKNDELREHSPQSVICGILPMKAKYYLIAFLVFLLDHGTKWMVCAKLDPARPIDLIAGHLSFSYAENTGVAFGFFNTVESPWKPYLLGGLAVAAVVIILIYSARMPRDRILLHWALAVIAGGILGNLADRIFRGYVVDFIDFHIHETFHWPAFNVADSAITVGIALLLMDTIKNPPRDEAPAEPPAGGSQ